MTLNSFCGGFLVLAASALFLAGCEESPRVQRREFSEPPHKASSEQDAHPSPTPQNPHDMTMNPHGEGAAPQEDWKIPAEVDLGPVHFTAPKDWVRKLPKSAMINKAEFAFPRAEGDPADGRLTIGLTGGTVEENVTRWRTQFVGKPEKESQDSLDVAGNKATLADFSGTYLITNMAFGSEATEAPHYRMLGAIVEVAGQLYFVKAYGPAKTMAARADEFRAFIKSLKVEK